MQNFALCTAYIGTVNISQHGEAPGQIQLCSAAPIQCCWTPKNNVSSLYCFRSSGTPMDSITHTWYLDLLELCLKTYGLGLKKGLTNKVIYSYKGLEFSSQQL